VLIFSNNSWIETKMFSLCSKQIIMQYRFASPQSHFAIVTQTYANSVII